MFGTGVIKGLIQTSTKYVFAWLLPWRPQHTWANRAFIWYIYFTNALLCIEIPLSGKVSA